MQPKWEVADVIGCIDLSDQGLTPHQEKTLRALRWCRTSALGGHVDACSDCGQVHISYNSCRNRHCPKCQGHNREQWIDQRSADLLPCTYYHLVFTLPEALNPLAIHHPRLVYGLLFQSAWHTLEQFGRSEGVGLGMVAILHTWGQNLSLHPHIHCVVPGGGVDAGGHWRREIRNNKYLFSVKAMSKVFRAQYVQGLRREGVKDQALLDNLFKKDWVVYAKRPFGGPRQVIEYLGRYTHKVAISNHRIEDVGDKTVSFSYKDYRKEGIKRIMTLSHREFIRRFSMHILPHRFVRIRHYGILSSSWKRGKLQDLQQSLGIQRLNNKDSRGSYRKCPHCQRGIMITIEIFGKRGPPSNYLLAGKNIPAS